MQNLVGHSLVRAASLAILAYGTLVSCTHKAPPPSIPLRLSFYAGISKVARMGDPESLVLKNTLFKAVPEPVDAASDLGKLGFTKIISFDEIGVRVFIRHSQVAMIEVHDHFPGVIEGKGNKPFGAPTPPEKGWEEALVQLYGFPQTRATGGRLGSAALFYSWGDISFNRVGPNEIALYQAPDIAAFRQKDFGQGLSLFKTH
jgi:hypothetical protein